MPRGAIRATILGIVLIVCASDAAAGPALITTVPALDPLSGEYVVFVGGIDESGRSLKASRVEVVLSGEASPVASTQLFSDWATVSTEHNGTWRPPLAVGLVYLWVKGVPRGVLDGIHAFFQRVPSRTTVLPTVYGRMRQGRASLLAADISRLDEEVPPLEGYRPNLVEAVRLDLADLAANPAPIKLLVLVTDGRDFADPKGIGPGDFTALGREIRKAGITLLAVGYPPEADASQGAENLRELHAAAGGFLRVLEQSEDLENTLESLGQVVGDLLRVEFQVPWTWRLFGASHRVSLRLMTRSGHGLSADVGVLEVPAGSFARMAILVAVGLVAVLLLGVWASRLRRRGGSVGDHSVVDAVHALIRRGTSPERAVQELAQTFAEAVSELVDLDPEVMNDPRFPYFRTRLGRQRLQEIQDLLANKSSAAPRLAPTIVQVLSEAVSSRTAPDLVAETMSARASVDECTAFAGMTLDQLAEVLRSLARDHAVLGTPRARGVAVAVQDALRIRGSSQRGIAVAWLVRAAGPGRRGETLRIGAGATLIGTGSQCKLRIDDDPSVAPEHAEIRTDGGDFTVADTGGVVSVEGTPVKGRHTLSDGETLKIGRSLFVFKMATVGNLLPETSLHPRHTVRRRSV